MSLSGFNGERGQAENVVFLAGEARQRMHIRAARRKRMPVLAKTVRQQRPTASNPIQQLGPAMVAKKKMLAGVSAIGRSGEYEDF
ncbi:hypothetical protein [Rhizobium leguminosarum]|uniref:hypothetical protein n=1 Tax=Rhizobium leguminosarum TaxID=384 RepID=UPI001C95F208|nr:hypothetical protein [Rhizobium leguminosarum]MBY5751008.1 hypothetical protein [Rhizobium leguminosarum]